MPTLSFGHLLSSSVTLAVAVNYGHTLFSMEARLLQSEILNFVAR